MITKLKIHPVFTLIIVAVVGAIGFGFPLEEVFASSYWWISEVLLVVLVL